MDAVPTPMIGTEEVLSARSTVCLGYDFDHGLRLEKYSFLLNICGQAPESQMACVTRGKMDEFKERNAVR